jgi:hypothetical protein
MVLTACGGGGDGTSAGEPSSGILEAGNVRGLHFETATQSGTTDAQGTFTYLPGESVTFSIGELRLGAAPGAAKISLFTLAGLTPPTTELSLRAQLDRTRRLATPLARAMNLARLLIALDADHNPDNGIDLTGRDRQLAGKQIDFGVSVGAFANRLERLAPDLTRNIPLSRPLTFLYAASNIMVAAHAPIRYEERQGAGLAFTTTVSYFPNGALAGEVTESNFVILGLNNQSNSYTYDALGRMTSRESAYLPVPFGGDTVSRLVKVYDPLGNLTSSVQEQLAGSGVLNSRYTATGTPDARGLYAEWISTEDLNGDGVPERRSTVLRTYDTRGNTVSTVVNDDTNADGRIDAITRFTDTFDASDRLQTELYEADSNADGVVDARSTVTYQPPANRVVAWTIVTDDDADGVVDQREYNRVTYDAAGNQVAWNGYGDLGTDDSTYSREEFLMTYDSERRLLAQVSTHDFDVDGVIDLREVITNVYDTHGNLLSLDRQVDRATPFDIVRQLSTYEYGANGERTAFTTRLDVDGDGTFEADIATQVTSAEFTNGVPMLGYEYFESPNLFTPGAVVVAGF